MHYIAGLHVHSHYSYATSKTLSLESLYQWTQIKGVDVVSTGDFTHPQWFQELKTKLIPTGSGFFCLRYTPQELTLFDIKYRTRNVHFCLTTEICYIYGCSNQIHRNHNLLYTPDLATAVSINAELAAFGNLATDGRPTLRSSSRDLLEIVLEASDQACLIPAHI